VIVIPAFNEASRLGPLLDQLRALPFAPEVVVIDDGSVDATSAVARRHGARVLRHPYNLGYGAALQTGYKYALRTGADILVQMDADGQHDPAQVSAVVEPVLRDERDLVIGSRFLQPGYRMGTARTLGRLFFRGVARALGLRISDPTSGFQAMNRGVLDLHAQDGFPVDYPDVDVLIAAYRNGLRIGEVAVKMSEGTRASTLHGGSRSVYYLYKMMLSIWTASGVVRRQH
jgi:glycosyltransferase involved in cell wall biosynthesis